MAAAPSRAPPRAPSSGTKKSSPFARLFAGLFLGGTIGAVAKTAMAPVETVKLLLQLAPAIASKHNLVDVAACVTAVVNNQGFFALWRGNLVNCLRYWPQQFSAIAFNDVINNAFPKIDPRTAFWKAFAVKLVAGGLAGTVANLICHPFDLARTVLAADAIESTPKFSGFFSVIFTVVERNGFSGLYAGMGATIVGAFAYRAFQLICFKQLQDLNPWKRDRGLRGAVSSFIAVTLARTIGMPFSYPFDTIRRCMMIDATRAAGERMFTGELDCAQKLGRGLFAGMAFEFARGIGGSIVIVLYDSILKNLR